MHVHIHVHIYIYTHTHIPDAEEAIRKWWGISTELMGRRPFLREGGRESGITSPSMKLFAVITIYLHIHQK